MNARPDLTKLRLFARRLRLGVDVGASMLVIVTALAVISPASTALGASAVLNTDGLPRGWAAGLVIIIVALLVAALVELHRMLGHVMRAPVFSSPVTRHFRRFTLLTAAAAASNIVLPWLAKAWLSHVAGRPVALTLTLQDLLLLFFAGVFYFVAEAFNQAAAFETDSEAFV